MLVRDTNIVIYFWRTTSSMEFYLGVTDYNWYRFLVNQKREDINFWKPGGKRAFRALSIGAPFLFKLKSPINAIGGIGFFSSFSFLPLSIAWDAFGIGNGCDSFQQLQKMIFQYRKDHMLDNPIIGCIILTNPIFFSKDDWIPVPQDWRKHEMEGQTYSTTTETGLQLWNKVQSLLEKYLHSVSDEEKTQLILEESEPLYGNSVLRKVRLGQGAFRILVTDAYNRRCTISGEKTLPVLESAHIKPYAKSGPHFISNALLLRSDLHKLFDAGYITITPDLKVEVSNRIKEEFENGKEYYRFHGNNIYNLPIRLMDKPESKFVEWHNENIYNG